LVTEATPQNWRRDAKIDIVGGTSVCPRRSANYPGAGTRMEVRMHPQSSTPMRSNWSVSRVCEQCGAGFMTYPARVRQGYARFCSRRCSSDARRKPVRDGDQPIARVCRHCGVSFASTRDAVRRGNGQFCGRVCRYAASHTPREAPLERFWRQVRWTPCCWLWEGTRTSLGYGKFGIGGRGRSMSRAHRWIYEQFAGPIPRGLHLDHLCRNPSCVRLDHLEPVTQAENNRRAWAARRAGLPPCCAA
jgi:hypothetical protein